MTAEGLLIWLSIGGAAGWLAGVIVQGGGFGIIGDIIVGILGSIIFGWLFGPGGLALSPGFVSSALGAVMGAVILIMITRVLTRLA